MVTKRAPSGSPQDLIDAATGYLYSVAPTVATAAGIHDHDHRLADYDADAIEDRRRAFLAHGREARRRLEENPPVDPDDALDLALLADGLEVEARLLEDVRAPFRDPSLYLDEILYGVYYLVQRDFAPLPERARSAALRLGQVPALLRQAERNLGDGTEIPRPWVEAGARQVRGSQAFLAELDRDLVPRAGAAQADLTRALAEARTALDHFARSLDGPLLHNASGEFATGRATFDFLLEKQHGLSIDADALFEKGQRLVTQAQERLEEAARGIDPHRTWRDLVSGWKSDHPDRDGLLAEYRREVDRAREFVRARDLVGLPSGEILEVVETPSFQRSVCPFAAYVPPGPFEADQRGFFWVTPPPDDATPEARESCLLDHLRPGIPGTVAHEGYPGHHLQLTLANRSRRKVRHLFVTAVLIEGWAFYCEELMAEEGFYKDPRARVLQLKDQLWRACRVVIDTGMQTRGMTVEEAVRMLVDVACLEEPSARGEVLRYARSATQPMSYAVGKEEILALREEYRRLRGPAFTLREFHDRLLSYGSIPVSFTRGRLLERTEPAEGRSAGAAAQGLPRSGRS